MKKLSLQCPICYEKITEPIRLQCKHLLCQKCFEMLVDLTTLSQRKCPKCRRWIKEIREIFCFGYTLGVLALLFYLCRTVAIDTGHFFHTSLAQCLIFLRHTLMARIQKLYPFFKGLRSFRGPWKQERRNDHNSIIFGANEE